MQGLQDVIGVSVTHPTWQRTRPDNPEDKHTGWVFASPGDAPLTGPTGQCGQQVECQSQGSGAAAVAGKAVKPTLTEYSCVSSSAAVVANTGFLLSLVHVTFAQTLQQGICQETTCSSVLSQQVLASCPLKRTPSLLLSLAGHGSFGCDGCIPDTINGAKFVRDLYEKANDKTGEGQQPKRNSIAVLLVGPWLPQVWAPYWPWWHADNSDAQACHKLPAKPRHGWRREHRMPVGALCILREQPALQPLLSTVQPYVVQQVTCASQAVHQAVQPHTALPAQAAGVPVAAAGHHTQEHTALHRSRPQDLGSGVMC